MKLFETCKSALTSKRGVGATMTALVIAAVVLLNSVVFTLVNTYGWYFRAADEIDFSLSPTAEQILAPVRASGERITVYFCMPKEELRKHETGVFLYGTALELEESYGDVFDLEYVNIVTKRNQDGELVDLSPYTKTEGEEEQSILKTSVIFVHGENYRVLSSSLFSDFFTLDNASSPIAYNGEEIFLSMALWVLTDEHPLACFTSSHSEIADIAFTRLLAAAGYKIDTVDLGREDVPDECDLLIISNPRSDFKRAKEGSGIIAEMERLTAYAERGGDLYVSLDPYLKRQLPVLESFLLEYGVSVRRTEVEDKKITDVVRDGANGITADGFTMVGSINESGTVGQQIANIVSAFRDGGIFVSTAGVLDVTEGHAGAEALLISSPSSETYAGTTMTDSKGSYTVGAIGARGDSRLFITSSVYIASSNALLTNRYANRELLYGVLECLFGQDAPMPYGANMILTDTTLLEDLTRTEIRLYTALALVPSVALLAVGAVVLRRRRYR